MHRWSIVFSLCIWIPVRINGAVETPPSILFPKEETKLIIWPTDTTNFQVRCLAEGYPKPFFEWYRGGKLLGLEVSRYILPSDDGALSFPSFVVRDGGWFQCKARNKYGTSVSNKVHLMTDPFRTLKLEKNTNKTKLKPWEPFSLPCPGIEDVLKLPLGNTSLQWREVYGGILSPTKRVGFDQQGTLHFAYVTKKDNGRSLLCAFTDNSRSFIWSVPMGGIEIQPGQFEKVLRKPKLQYHTKTLDATWGKDAILECFFSAIPEAKIAWRDSKNSAIQGGHFRYGITDFGRKLTIRDVVPGDIGVYTCTGSNDAGSDSGKNRLGVIGPPLAVRGGALVPQTVPAGSDVVLKCITHAPPKLSVSTPVWYINGEPLTQANVPDRSRYQFKRDMTELHIANVQKRTDIACFQCNVTNKLGFAFFDAYLRVIDPIVISKRPRRVIWIDASDIVDLTINAKSDQSSKVTITWHFEGKRVNIFQPPFKFLNSSRSLYFDAASVPLDVLKTKMGNYKCKVFNVFQVEWVEVNIDLKSNEPTYMYLKDLWWLLMVCFMFGGLATLYLVLIVTCMQRGLCCNRSKPKNKNESPPPILKVNDEKEGPPVADTEDDIPSTAEGDQS